MDTDIGPYHYHSVKCYMGKTASQCTFAISHHSTITTEHIQPFALCDCFTSCSVICIIARGVFLFSFHIPPLSFLLPASLILFPISPLPFSLLPLPFCFLPSFCFLFLPSLSLLFTFISDFPFPSHASLLLNLSPVLPFCFFSHFLPCNSCGEYSKLLALLQFCDA